MSQYNAILLLGSNIGDRKKNIFTALGFLENRVGKVLKKTEILETEPVEFCSSNYFFNFALLINTALSPIQLLKAIKKIESEMGRKADTSAIGYFTDRIIDIDIVRYSGIMFRCEKLQIPHLKHLTEREFSKKILENLK